MKISELFNIEGKIAVVTGGASGIGEAYATVLADNGAQVCIMDLDEAALSAALERLRKISVSATAWRVDVTDAAALKAAFNEVEQSHGRLDVVFANAGVGGGPGFLTVDGLRNDEGAIENVSTSQWDHVLAVNLDSVFHTIQAAVPHMKRQKEGGRIIVTTSVAATKTENFLGTAYFAAKAGAAHLVRQAAVELARYNILVNAIAPGSFKTQIGNGRMTLPTVASRLAATNPMNRIASTDEIQGIALFLASPASSFVTGAEFLVDGGTCAGLAE